ncbi:MAG: hypothetical protein Q8M56_17155, partial [Desulfobacterales bacterium]|nr:hypothetical protein [Desulfobacterales bacterium]
TKVVYIPDPADPPTLKRTNELAQLFHDKFDKFLFGWTAAAGGQTQEKITLKNFQLYFDREPVACGGYGVWNNLAGPGTTRYFAINGTGCIGILNGSQIGNIGPNGTIKGYLNSNCLSGDTTTPSELTYNQAMAADIDTDCAVYFNGTDK